MTGITSSKRGVWILDDAYKKVLSDYWTYEGSNNEDGSLWGWGTNTSGELGLNDVINRSSPAQIPGNQWTIFNIGRFHSQSLKIDGTLWSLGGNNSLGQLGNNSVTPGSSPVQIPGNSWNNIACNTEGNFILATKSDGTLWSWGQNSAGQVGDNSILNRSSPVQIPGTSWCSIAGGRFHGIGVKTDGTLWTWGYNASGRLGDNTVINKSSPIQIPGTSWVEASGGSQFTLARKTDGTAWAWGLGYSGQLGINDAPNPGSCKSSPMQIPGTQWNQVTGGYLHSHARKTDGTIWSFGQNNGQLGINAAGPGFNERSSPVQIPGTSWCRVIAGGCHGLALKTNNTLWAWGCTANGSLGDNANYSRSSPVQIPGSQWQNISAGKYTSMAKKRV